MNLMKGAFFKFLLLTILFLFFTELTKSILNIDDLLYNSLSEKLTLQQIKDLFDFQDKWKWLGYVFLPIYFLLKTIIIATVLYIGSYFFVGKDILFKSFWEIVINAEFIFLLVPFFKLFWFYFIEVNFNLEDFQYFYPLSAINIIGYKGLDIWYLYPFQTLNLFELVYIIYISNQLGKITNTNIDNGFKIMSYSYIPSLLLWVVFIMFVTLNIS